MYCVEGVEFEDIDEKNIYDDQNIVETGSTKPSLEDPLARLEGRKTEEGSNKISWQRPHIPHDDHQEHTRGVDGRADQPNIVANKVLLFGGRVKDRSEMHLRERLSGRKIRQSPAKTNTT